MIWKCWEGASSARAGFIFDSGPKLDGVWIKDNSEKRNIGYWYCVCWFHQCLIACLVFGHWLRWMLDPLAACSSSAGSSTDLCRQRAAWSCEKDFMKFAGFGLHYGKRNVSYFRNCNHWQHWHVLTLPLVTGVSWHALPHHRLSCWTCAVLGAQGAFVGGVSRGPLWVRCAIPDTWFWGYDVWWRFFDTAVEGGEFLGEASRVQRVLRVLSLHLFLTIIIDLSMFFLSFNGPQEVKNRVLNTKRVQVIPSVLLLKSI